MRSTRPAFAARLAAALSARLTLMTAYDAPSEALGEPNYSRALGEALGEAQKVLEDARRVALNAGGPEPQVEWLAGEPAATIVDTAQAGGYDLVVMGTLGRRSARRGPARLGLRRGGRPGRPARAHRRRRAALSPTRPLPLPRAELGRSRPEAGAASPCRAPGPRARPRATP